MKRNLIFFLAVSAFCSARLSAQFLTKKNVNESVKLKELEVPNSPAFTIADITPSLIETPSTPKKFVLGIAQSFQQSGNTFPQNYSAEFTPYWWLNNAHRSVYSLLGLKSNLPGQPNVTREDPFSGLKFTSFSIAFLNKDLIPDTSGLTQKLFSAGVRTTIIKIHPQKYYTSLSDKIAEWHETALRELMNSPIQAQLTREDDTAKRRKIIQQYLLTPSSTREIVEDINDIILQKPIFCWDVAAAYMVYGVGDTSWRTGRSGIWTNVSSYLPLDLGTENNVNKNYLNLNFSVRFLSDNYFKNNKGNLIKANVIDVGGKLAFEFDAFTIGYEYLKRSGKGVSTGQKRSVGVINYKLSDNIYINGAFGQNFNLPDKLIALFGIKWGLGKETVTLPDK